MRHAWIVLLLLIACSQQQTPESKNDEQATAKTEQASALPAGAVARVGETVLTEKDIDREFLHMPERVRQLKDQVEMRKNLLHNIITRKALEEEARRQGIADDPEIRARIEQTVASIVIQALNDKMRKQQQPDEKALREYYQQHRADYRVPATWRVRHILVKDEEQARRLLKRLRKGADFAALAREFSQDASSRMRGGELPSVRRGQMPPAFEKAMLQLNAEHPLSGVVHSRMGYHLIQWIESRPAHVRPFEELRAQIAMQIQQQRFREWVEEVKERQGIEILKAEYRQPELVSPVAPNQIR